jgi:hypothetical protein
MMSHFDIARQYLEERLDDLVRLSSDLRCRPFAPPPTGDGSPTGERGADLVVAVDWSEVYAYIAADAPPSHDRLVKLVQEAGSEADVAAGAEVARVAHQVALLMLFERLPSVGVPVILLPPYVRELEHYVRLTQARILREEGSGRTLREIEARMSREASVDREIEEIITLTAGLRDVPEDERYAKFKEIVRDRETQVEELVEKAFGDMLRTTLLSARRPMKALRRLLEKPTEAGEPALRTMSEVLPTEVLDRLRPDLLRTEHWGEELRRQDHKSGLAFIRDAEALSLLEQLGPLLHEWGRQIVFVTRDRHLLAALEASPGRFAYLTSSEAAPLGDRAVSTIGRSWRVMLELALTLELGREGGNRLDRARAAIERRIADTPERLEELRTGRRGRPEDGTRPLAGLLEQIRTSVQNSKAVLSTESPVLHTLADSRHNVIRLFVKYVTDPEGYAQARGRLRRRFLEEIDKRQFEALVKLHSDQRFTRSDEVRAGFSPLAPKLLEGLGPRARDAFPSGLRQVFDLLVVQMQGGREGAGTAQDDWKLRLEQLRDLAGRTRSSEPQIASAAAALLILAGRSRDAFENINYLSSQYREVLDQGGVAEAAIESLCLADRELIMNEPLAAAQQVREGHAAIDEGIRRGASRPHDAIWHLAYLNAALLFHLDMADRKQERVHDFPRALQDTRRFALDCSLEVMVTSMRGPSPELTDRLRSRISNNIVYAAAKLAPIYAQAEWAVPEWCIDDERFRRRGAEGARPIHAWMLHNAEVDRHHRALSEVPPGERTPSATDTLSYWNIKLGCWRHPGSVERVRLWAQAAEWLEAIRSDADASRRMREAATAHLELLDDLRELARSGAI